VRDAGKQAARAFLLDVVDPDGRRSRLKAVQRQLPQVVVGREGLALPLDEERQTGRVCRDWRACWHQVTPVELPFTKESAEDRACLMARLGAHGLLALPG